MKEPTHGSLAQALATTSRFDRESSGYALQVSSLLRADYLSLKT
jgi:hypothetical protein